MKKASWGSAAFMAAAYGTNAVYQGYISKFYQQRGAQGQALAWLLVSFPLLSLPGQPLWGMLADRGGNRIRTLRIVIALSALAVFLLGRQTTVTGLLLLACAVGFCYPAIQPLGDSVILAAENGTYGKLRLAGCLTYAAVSLGAGRLLRDDYLSVPIWTALGLGGLLAVSFLLPTPQGQKQKTDRVSWLRVFRIPSIKPLLGLFMLLQMTLGYFYSYYAVYLTSFPGATSRVLGWSLFLATVSEIPFLLLGDRLFRRLGAGRLLLLAALSLAARFFWLGCAHSLTAALYSQLLHGLGFVVMTFSMAKYISLAAPKALRSTGQTVTAAAGAGIARVIGSLTGGYLGERLGLRVGFLCMGAAAFFAFVAFLPVFLRTAALNGKR